MDRAAGAAGHRRHHDPCRQRGGAGGRTRSSVFGGRSMGTPNRGWAATNWRSLEVRFERVDDYGS
jgi:hypothetical protein